MRVGSRVPGLILLILPALSGCQQGQSWFGAASPQQQAQLEQIRQQQLAAAQQQQQMQATTASMDRVNEEKERELAASRQDVQRLEAQVTALSTRLKETATDVVSERTEKQALEKKYDDLVAQNRRVGTVSIAANSSHKADLAGIEIRGVDVRRDGDVIRVTLGDSQLFAPGSYQLSVGAQGLLDTVGTELARAYPRQLIGVEGHSDGGGAAVGVGGQDAHQLSVLQALAVYNYLASRGSLRPEQLHVAGYGNAHPIYSNATPAGREANQRIELVVYPETLAAAPQ